MAFTLMTQLFQSCPNFLRSIKHPLLQDLLFLVKLAVLDHNQLLFQKNLKLSITMWKIFVIKVENFQSRKH